MNSGRNLSGLQNFRDARLQEVHHTDIAFLYSAENSGSSEGCSNYLYRDQNVTESIRRLRKYAIGQKLQNTEKAIKPNQLS